MTDTNQLPPMPEPEGFADPSCGGFMAYTADQMRAFALQARAHVQGAPFAWVEHHKGGDNLVWDEPGGRKSPLYTTPQPAQATQAEVTDAQILSLDCVSIDSDAHGTSFWVDRSTVVNFARAILALRTERVPMTPDEISDACDEAIANSILSFMKGVRAAEAHHGITAQAKKETP